MAIATSSTSPTSSMHYTSLSLLSLDSDAFISRALRLLLNQKELEITNSWVGMAERLEKW